MQWDHEIVIVGGGMVGAALAARLGQAGMSVGLVERASAPTPPSGDYDLRISSLNARSLAFAHPADGRGVEITSPYPTDLQQALDVLRRLAR